MNTVTVARWVGIVCLGLATGGLFFLHLIPPPLLHATTGALIPYRPWNFLSEFARTDYAPLITTCFFLMGIGTLSTGVMLRPFRREAILLALAGIALLLLGCFPTDLSDLTSDVPTCNSPGRIEPCTLIGRIHNPLSTVVFFPIMLAALSAIERGRRYPRWRGFALLAVVCGCLAGFGVVGATAYMHSIGWEGRWWTGLMQRSLVFPAFLWIGGLLLAGGGLTRKEPVAADRR